MKDLTAYFQSLAPSIHKSAAQLADIVEKKVPEEGSFRDVYVDWIDSNGELDIKEWRFKVQTFPASDGIDVNKRFVEIIAFEDGGYGISLLVYGGYKAECVATLRSSDFVDRLIDSMITCLNA